VRFDRRPDADANRPTSSFVRTHMDNSNLFSHPEAPEHVVSDETSGKPVEHPVFSDRPNGDAGARAKERH